MTSFQIPVKGSGRVRQVRGDFRSAGSSPRCHLTGAAHAHPGGGRSCFLSFSLHKLLPQSTNLLTCDHPHLPPTLHGG